MNLLKRIKTWASGNWLLCPKQQAGYNCTHRKNECDND